MILPYRSPIPVAKLLASTPAGAAERDFRLVMPLVDSSGRDWWTCTDPYGGLHIRTGQPERLLELSDGPAAGRQLLLGHGFPPFSGGRA